MQFDRIYDNHVRSNLIECFTKTNTHKSTQSLDFTVNIFYQCMYMYMYVYTHHQLCSFILNLIYICVVTQSKVTQRKTIFTKYTHRYKSTRFYCSM